MKEDLEDNWSNRWNSWNYVQLAPGTDKAAVETYLSDVSVKQYAEQENDVPSFYLQKITDINPGPMVGNAIGPGIPMLFVYFLAGMALVIILSACFNYTNLSLARSLNRAREVGVRKVFGASRAQIITQFLAESVLISVFAFIFSLGVLTFIKPIFLGLNFSQLLDWNLSESVSVYTICLGFSVFVGLAAGIVPSIFHSSVRAMEALKSLAGVKVFSKMGMRNFLIVSQFGLSLFLIITVKLVYNQMNFMIKTDYGFDAENIVVVRMNGADPQLLQNELIKYPNLISSSQADFVPASGTSSTSDVMYNEEEYTFNQMSVDHAYVNNMGLDLLAGTGLIKGQEDNQVILNESAAKALQFDFPRDAIGQRLLRGDSTYNTIVGVVADYHHETMFSAIKPLMLFHDPERLNILQVKVNATNFSAALHDIEAAWATVNPDLQFDYKIMNEEIAFFAELIFGDLSKIVTFISLLALIIAALGLMGMVVYAMQVRMKEVSIRKVLGSTSGQLVYVLSKKFLMLLVIAIIVSLPLTYLVNSLWLDAIAYSVNLSVGVILFGVGVIVLLGALVVGSQTWKTANTNPSEVLRYE
ncbi:MAG: FtsX-like permease family protein [Cytophagales bacterium]|nr:FtsX-like permease family protein [Cytophagales bacterium]